MLVREPPLLWCARRPDEAEKRLAQCVAKCEVECLNEFLTDHEHPLDDAEMIRKDVFVVTKGNTRTGATLGEGPSLALLGEDTLCATLEEQHSEALEAVIEESEAICPREQLRGSQSGNSSEVATARQAPAIEQILPGRALTFTQFDDDAGDSDDDERPHLDDQEMNVASLLPTGLSRYDLSRSPTSHQRLKMVTWKVLRRLSIKI
ncbi:hypothetical protein HPB52_023569 [Rhipicephalus sanguineus]|uniref:Uncharacterized protein n=1 Tax=Rhipicephalus sanguineus TaxID=34632 RepID=A0A9D4PE89_RHISA|nr:hypothetical protein HPB52_023569 [Rhipicephalus sanguineus]